MTMITTRGNYDYIYDHMINVTILNNYLSLFEQVEKKTKIHSMWANLY